MRNPSIAMRPAAPRRVAQPDRPAKLADRSAPDFGPNRLGQCPHPYQRPAIEWMRATDRCLLGDDLGLGKCLMTLRSLYRSARVLLVAPPSVANTWLVEIPKWSEFRVSLGDFRRPDEGEIVIVSYDSLPELSEWTTRLTNEPMRDVDLVFDECQMIKNEDAARTKKARKLASQCRTVKGLSATPMLGNPEDLWGVLFSLGLAGRAFPEGRDYFVELCGGKPRFCYVKGRRKRIGFEWGEVSPVVKERLKRVMMRRLADEVLDQLPERQMIDLPVPAPESLIPFLTKVKQQWDAVGPNDMPPFELLSEAMTALARAKMSFAADWIDMHASDEFPMLVFSAHIDPVNAMSKLKGVATITGEDSGPAAIRERRKIVDAFQAGKHRILAMTIKTGGAGLNLQRAAGVLFVDRAYTPGDNAQAYGRARRQGNVRQRVPCWRMISGHPLDEHLSSILDRKEKQITAAVG